VRAIRNGWNVDGSETELGWWIEQFTGLRNGTLVIVRQNGEYSEKHKAADGFALMRIDFR